MRRHLLLSIAVAATAPLSVDVVPTQRDSSVTTLTIGAGTASYAYITRGCDNSVLSKDERYFHDAGASIEHKFPFPVRIGVRAVALDDLHPNAKPLERKILWNPNVSLEWRGFSIGGGYVARPDAAAYVDEDFNLPPFSAHIRVGNPDKAALAIRVFEDIPPYSGAGIGTIGIEGPFVRRVRMMLGLAVPEPYDEFGLAMKAKIRVTKALDLNVGGRLGGSEGINEMGINAGLSYSFIHRSQSGGAAPRDSEGVTHGAGP